MSYTFPSPSIPASNVKVRWKEQYGSSGFNKKLAGIIPAGIYRGLTLSTSGSNNTVTVVPDSVHQDHLAVCENIDGFSLTFRDASNTTYSLALTDASLLSQTVVITFFANYEEGQITTANFVGYTLAEYNGLSAAVQRELVVLGTVVNPAGGNLIISSAITQDRRTIASFNSSLLTWRPLIQNPGFERSATGQVLLGFQAEGWTTNGGWETNNADVGSGTRNAEFAVASGGTFSNFLRQYVGAGVVAGQRILVKAQKKIVGAATSGTGTIELGFVGADGGSASILSSSFVINSTDGSYQPLSAYFAVPAGAIELKYIGIQLTSAVYAGAGSKVRIDNFTALLEPVSTDDQLNSLDERLRSRSFSAVVLEDPSSTAYEDLGAYFHFNKNLPTTNEGQVVLERKDASAAANAPAWSQPGRFVNVGSSLTSSSSDALLPRIGGPISTAMGATYTLLHEWTPSGDKPFRLYVSSVGDFIFTKNLVWDGAQWNKTVAGDTASFAQLNPDGLSFYDLTTNSSRGTSFSDTNTLISGLLSPNMFQSRTYDFVVNRVKTAKSDVFNLSGRLQRYGYHYFEDFVAAIDASVYSANAGAMGTVDTSFSASGTPNALIVTSGTAGTESYLLGQNNLAAWNQQTDLSMLMRFKFTGDANAIRKLGLGYLAAGPVDTLNVGFVQNDSSHNLLACVRDSSGTATPDTGFKPTIGTWYHALFNQFHNGTTGSYKTNIEWWISTTEDFNDGGIVSHGTTHLTDGISPAPSRVIAPYFMANTAVSSSSIIVDYYQVWENQGR